MVGEESKLKDHLLVISVERLKFRKKQSFIIIMKKFKNEK